MASSASSGSLARTNSGKRLDSEFRRVLSEFLYARRNARTEHGIDEQPRNERDPEHERADDHETESLDPKISAARDADRQCAPHAAAQVRRNRTYLVVDAQNLQ